MTHLCGPREPSKGDIKVVHRYRKFLQGKGNRCPECLHKASKHSDVAGKAETYGCLGKGCDCDLTKLGVNRYRKNLKKRGKIR